VVHSGVFGEGKAYFCSLALVVMGALYTIRSRWAIVVPLIAYLEIHWIKSSPLPRLMVSSHNPVGFGTLHPIPSL
jgi:hypothetical protein